LDLYFIIRDHFPLQAVIERAVTLFPGLFSEKLFRQQLCYFEDVDYTEEVSFLPGHEIDETTIKAFLIDIATKEL